jgi:Acyl-CoA reductase (LuxC)
MQKCGDVAIYMLPCLENLRYVGGEREQFSSLPLQPFAEEVRRFVGALSTSLMTDSGIRGLPDLVAFAWWCRKANIEKLAVEYANGQLRIGRGIAFHITPANMPVNFAFSWVFSLLAGNANIVRIPSRDFPQIQMILDHVRNVFATGQYPIVQRMTAFVSFGREQEITEALSAVADVRIIWGGDETIRTIRKTPLSPRAIDVCFADRYSMCVLGADGVLAEDQKGLERLAGGFFNDAYIMDQNACSSPRLVMWYGKEQETNRAATKFWSAVESEARRRYALAPVTAVEKLMQACRDAVDFEPAVRLNRNENFVYRVQLSSLEPALETRRCGSGYFYEYRSEVLDAMVPAITSRYQTLTYFGVDTGDLSSLLVKHRMKGIDRIVPVGEAMNIGLVWDGYDLIHTLSRVCDVR